MKVVVVYARIYASCFVKALTGVGRSWWTLFLPILLLVIDSLLGTLLAKIPLAGGFLRYFANAALGSCYLYFVGEVVARSRPTLGEFRKSIGAYFWSIANLLFVFWIADLVVGVVVKNDPRAALAYTLLRLGAYVVFNAVPEVLYQKGTVGGLATMQRTLHFIQENWIEWFIPNLLVAGAAWWAIQQPWAPAALGFLGGFGFMVLGGAFLHVFMIYRGHLFAELDGSTHRQRMFRYRSAA